MLQFENVCCTIKNKKIIDSVSFCAPKGAVTALLGRNGSGKTSLMHCIMDVYPVSSGTITLNNTPVSKTETGFVPERPALFAELTGREFLRFVMSAYQLTDMHALDTLGRYFELDHFMDTAISAYPKGIKQKFSIIAALMHNPSLIIMDEPFSGLDPVSARLLKELILKEKKSKTLILSTHILEIAQALADHIVVIDSGRCIAEGSFSELKSKHAKESLDEIFISLTGREHYRELVEILEQP